MNELTLVCSGQTVNIYPYNSTYWQNHVDRFGFSVPKNIVDRTMGKSVCDKCKQVYSGNQPRCTRLRWGYKTRSWQSSPDFGYYMVGEYNRHGDKVCESREYECDGYLSWDLSETFSKQQQLFSTLDYLVNALPTEYKPEGFNLTLDQREKIALFQRIDFLTHENNMVKQALREVINRLNQGGQGLLGGNFSF